MDNQQTKKTKTLKKVEENVKAIIGQNLTKINQQYHTTLQMARFTDLTCVEQLGVMVEAGLDKDENEQQGLVFFINGSMQPTDRLLFEKFTYLFINMLDEKIDQKLYSLVYFVGDEMMSSGFTRFRQFMKLLPVKYYVRMKKMYVYHASLLVRSFLFFESSRRGKLWKKRTQFIGELSELFDIPSFHKRWTDFIPENFKYQIDVNMDSLRRESLAECPQLEENVQSIFGRELSSYEMNSFGIPRLLDYLLSYFTEKPERLHSQGIFRKSGSVSQSKQLAQLLSQGNFDSLKIVTDVDVVADIIKKYFHQLSTPLIDFDSYKMIVTYIPTLHETDAEGFIQKVMSRMNGHNKRVLYVMISFLYDIVKYEHLNKMSSYNISVVFAPCLMWAQHQTVQEVLNIGLCIRFLSLMLKYYTNIFPNQSYKLLLEQSDASQSSSSNCSTPNIDQQLHQEEQKDQEMSFSMDSILRDVSPF